MRQRFSMSSFGGRCKVRSRKQRRASGFGATAREREPIARRWFRRAERIGNPQADDRADQSVRRRSRQPQPPGPHVANTHEAAGISRRKRKNLRRFSCVNAASRSRKYIQVSRRSNVSPSMRTLARLPSLRMIKRSCSTRDASKLPSSHAIVKSWRRRP